MRGKQRHGIRGIAQVRSIPACAGETRHQAWWRTSFAVYPRVCGGNARTWEEDVVALGLSPRVRGKRGLDRLGHSRRGSIPACAGETRPGCGTLPSAAVYPRVCGGNALNDDPLLKPGGLSPRVRGKRNTIRARCRLSGSIPACAGETGYDDLRRRDNQVYPRVCGGNCRRELLDVQNHGLSPRVRGKLPATVPVPAFPWSIPACAGET